MAWLKRYGGAVVLGIWLWSVMGWALAAAPAPGREVVLAKEDWKALNRFFNYFAEVSLAPFERDRLGDPALIEFGLLHSYWNNRQAFEAPSNSGWNRVRAEVAEGAAEKFFGRKPGRRQSVPDAIRYENGYYEIKVKREESFYFAQVTRFIDHGQGLYTAELNIYMCTGSCFIGDFNNSPEEWKRLGDVPDLSRKVRALIWKVGDGSSSRYILLEYLTLELLSAKGASAG